MKQGQSLVIYGDGEQSRDGIYPLSFRRAFVSNVVQANLLACHNDAGEFSGEVFNAAIGKRVTINALVTAINKNLKKEIKPQYLGL